nr:high mobility group nucleosome-binding domain-containing protein 5 [Vicugna pacos]
MPKRKTAGQDDMRQEPKRRSARLSALPVPITPELKSKRTSTPRKMKTKNMMEKNSYVSAKAVAETKKEVVKDEYNNETAENGEAKIIEAPASGKELEETNEEKFEDVKEEEGKKREAMTAARMSGPHNPGQIVTIGRDSATPTVQQEVDMEYEIFAPAPKISHCQSVRGEC